MPICRNRYKKISARKPIEFFVEKIVRNLCFGPKARLGLTTVDESKGLNPSEGRIAYTAYLRGEKNI